MPQDYIDEMVNKNKYRDVLKVWIAAGWLLTEQGIISPSGEIYTPDNLAILEWKAAFYDRGKRHERWLPDNPKEDLT